MAASSAADVPPAAGRTVVVTGANSGIGRVTARVLAERGARVVLAVRDLAKGREAASTMAGDVVVRRLDLADLSSVARFVAELTEPVDVLINNAGLSLPPLSRTVDGFELQLGTNHLGHFALTNLLLPQIRGRVVTVSSQAHRLGSLDLTDLNWERRPYRANPAYGQSKLANLLFTAELQRRLGETGSPVIATAAHPGISVTNLFRPQQDTLRARLGGAVLRLVAQSEEEGARPVLHAATADVPGNSYLGPNGFMEIRGAPTLVGRAARARDLGVARRLWEVSEELTGTTFPRRHPSSTS
ncbi:oxidoreductase [Auraticoccus monumenti]|uniref:Short-chain dehydrogenase n=1 Tax=Auraticoccus monumenti TaxID=675864 RepID=A0A1G6ZZ72_9ACTN|nr:oxidoreductase [Auraticoccus monumenti]SDE07862.1 Short-chain dehydrogenase [Auraticoccus monumenti]